MSRLLPDTVRLDAENGVLLAIDQSKLPNSLELIALKTPEEIRDAIRALKIRGAPAIGVAAAMGYYLAARNGAYPDTDSLTAALKEAKAVLASSRPTAVNLFWALERMDKAFHKHHAAPVGEITEALLAEAGAIRDEDIAACRAIGEHGVKLLKDGCGVLTHCNAGWLAAVRYGTALAPVYLAHEQGVRLKVFAGETRPLLQGARLTAFELSRAGIDVTLIADNMASRVMRNGWVDAVITGCDRVAANGDVCNKVGTSGLAVLAAYYGIPFYVCAPVSTIDPKTPTGAGIPIEERPGSELTELWYREPMTATNVRTYNPSFDVTPRALITAMVTERGILKPPFGMELFL
ncbi:MAG: S-methyl-5-thioribose-1-phosphate isomerase [Oscillospiraceae bacterium]|jgi:methylthioribose-1-phosphate isomerase|nr:S-methyl-5-thioribose-1-phosphate isomerase [Oscillospiraceae bacterium]